MTKFELYTQIRDFFNGSLRIMDQQEENEFFAEAIELCEKELASLEKAAQRNEKRKAEKAAENEELSNRVLATVGDGVTASDVAVALDLNVQKASSLLRALVNAGKLNVEDTKIPKKGTQKFYTLAV